MITPELISKVKTKLSSSRASYDHFFATIQDPAWIEPLAEAGFFKTPEPAIEQDGYISFPFWPESQYLLRMADKDPKAVLQIIQKNIDSMADTKNQRVHEDIVQILLKLDSDSAVRFTTKVVELIDKSTFLRVPDIAADLAVKFAEDGQIGAALRIAETLLEVKPDPRLENMDKEESKYALIEPQIKFGDYEYQEIAKKLTPSLTKANATKAIDLFSGLLDKAIRYKLLQYAGEEMEDDESAWEDYSNIWRPKIEDGVRSYEHQPRHGLVSSLRDSLTIMLESDIAIAEKRKLLDQICSKKFTIFKRIVEYVLRDYKDQEGFKDLYASLFKELNPITDPKKLRQDPYEFTPSAGITLEELAKLSDDQLIEKLKSYKPPELFFGREAMADLVTALVKSNPDRYLKLSERVLNETKDHYVNSLLTAAADVAENLSEERINDVLEMAELFLARSPQENNDDDDEDSRHYNWSRMSITRLAYKLVAQKPGKSEFITKETAKKLLDVLLILCRDPDPTEAHEKKYGGDNMDPPTLSVNTTRGEALHAIARMIGWAKRNKEEEYFLPKIYEELEWHLDAKNDPSLAIRAVYGQWFPWIWDADKSWAEKNVDRIFSKDEHGDAAWGAYLTLNQVFNDVFKFLEPVFRERLSQLKEYQEPGKNRFNSREHFTNHLMVAYWRGLVGLEKDSIIREFFDNADVRYRAEALRFIGFEVRKGAKVDAETQDRLVKLWEYRLKELKANPDKGTSELEQFGSWFASASFDKNWAISTLLESLKLAGNADPDFMVLEKLETLANDFLVETMEALAMMIQGARERWAIDSWRGNTMSILKTAYSSGNKQAKDLAIEQANLLVSKGYPMFREAIK
jgi:hypothetical protein